jgi:citrate lyase subunit beta/citryl-CoA lyase
MKMRSMLFVPADSERKITKAFDSGADALILDLEDSVAPAQKVVARCAAARILAERAAESSAMLFVRINPLTSRLALDDLASIVAIGLTGIMLPKADGAADVLRLGHYLEALEARAGLPIGAICIIPVATETAQAVMALNSYRPGLPRLAGLTWGAEDLAAAVGAVSNREPDGSLSPLYALASSLCLCAGAAAEVHVLDTLYANYRDPTGLAHACHIARRRGFAGKIAIHPDQVAVINEAFSPSDDEIAKARLVIAAFAAQPAAGTIGIDGVMYDLPHLKQARRLLGLEA